MKKLAIYCLLLALAALAVPKSQAAPRCISYTQFCDQVQYDTANIGGVTGTLAWGDWDSTCSRSVSNSIHVIGKGGTKLVLAGNQDQLGDNTSYALIFKKSSLLEDFSSTTGLAGGGTRVLPNVAYTQANGTCGWGAEASTNGKPRMIDAAQ